MNLFALDHRRLFERMVSAADGTGYARIVALKWLAFEAFAGAAPGIGLLIDEQYGAAAALAAKRRGVLLAMPIERNEAPSFELEYGRRFADHVDAFEPDLVKLLFRYEPAAPAFERSLAELAAVNAWSRGRKLLLELIPEGGRTDRLAAAITHLLALGLRPAVWKVPVPAPADVPGVVAAVRAAPGSESELLALGGGHALGDAVAALAAAVGPGRFTGWAVGRALWFEPLTAHLAGKLSETAAVRAIRGNLQRLAEATWTAAARS